MIAPNALLRLLSSCFLGSCFFSQPHHAHAQSYHRWWCFNPHSPHHHLVTLQVPGGPLMDRFLSSSNPSSQYRWDMGAMGAVMGIFIEWKWKTRKNTFGDVMIFCLSSYGRQNTYQRTISNDSNPVSTRWQEQSGWWIIIVCHSLLSINRSDDTFTNGSLQQWQLAATSLDSSHCTESPSPHPPPRKFNPRQPNQVALILKPALNQRKPPAAAIFKPTPTWPSSLVESLVPLPLHRVNKHKNWRQGWNRTIGLWKTSSRKIVSSWQHCKVPWLVMLCGETIAGMEKNEHIIPWY